MTTCCPPTAHGFMSTNYVPKGTIKVLVGGVEAYVSGNPCPCSSKGTRAIILVSDVWGYSGGRTRAIADLLAKDVADVVVVPRLLTNTFEGGTEGDGLPPFFDMKNRRSEFIKWMKSYNYKKDWQSSMNACMNYAKSVGAIHIGLLGYCFGGMLTTLTAMESSAVTCMVVTHPSLGLWENCFGGESPAAMCAKVTIPTLFHPAGDDDLTYYPGGDAVEALRQNSLASRSEPFPMMNHGFVVRGNIKDASISRDVDACLNSTIKFFKEHFSNTPKIRLTYFAIPGRAESTRLALTVGSIDFVDERITSSEWAVRKASKPQESLKQLPLLEVNGQEIGQSKAIVRYAGKVSGLYPNDPFIAAQVDLVLDSLDDRLQLFQPTFGISDPMFRVNARREIAGALPPTGDRTAAIRFDVVTQALNDRVGNNIEGFVVGPTLTIADLALFCDQSALNGGWLDGLDQSCFIDEKGQHKYPHLVAHRHRIANLPAVKKFYTNETARLSPGAKDIRLYFRPDPITVGYWAIQGLASSLRMMVLFAEVPLLVKAYKITEDPATGAYNKNSWFKAKPLLAQKFPLVNLPYVKDGDLIVSQTNACLAYLGRRLGLWGHSFSEEVECEEFLCEITDLHNALFDFAYNGADGLTSATSGGGVDESETAQAAKVLMDKVSEGCLFKLNSHMMRVKAKGSSGSFLVGDHATAPDFHLWTVLHQFGVLASRFSLPSPTDETGPFPYLAEYFAKFKNHRNNERYLGSILHTEMPFNSKYARFGSALPDGSTYVRGSKTPELEYDGLY